MAIIAVEQRQLLLAIYRTVGVIEIEHDGFWRRGIGLEKHIYEGLGHPIELRPTRRMLQPGDRGLAGQGGLLVWHLMHGELECGIIPQGGTIIGIRIPAGHLVDPLGQEGLLGMRNVCRMARIGHTGVQRREDPDLGFRLPQQQDAGIRGEVSTLIINANRLAGHGGDVEGKIHLVLPG